MKKLLAAFAIVAITAGVGVTNLAWAHNDNNDKAPQSGYGKDQCKNGGWKNFDGQNGNPGPFKNQGDCVSWFNHHDGHGNDDNNAPS